MNYNAQKFDKNEYELQSLGSETKKEALLAPVAPKQTTSLATYSLIIFIAIGVKVIQPLTIANAKNEDGSYRFNESTMVLLVEIVKLIFCTCVFAIQYKNTEDDSKSELHNLPFKMSLHFLVPALLYAASNTLVYYGISYINPGLFHVFGNIRILIAGILYRFMMGKKQSDLQWLSLILIACGAVLSSPAPEHANSSDNYLMGLLLLSLMSVCSTSASIYTEKYFKKTQKLSIFYQNIILYLYGILVNTFVVVFLKSEEKGAFDGFDQSGFMVLAAQSAMGVSLSFIFKYLDNIVYVISLTVAMLITAVISMMFFDLDPTYEFFSSMAVITIGIYIFYRSKLFEKFGIQDLVY
ncbi:hypothetical protein SteCoe_3684 [Stentor coeruleus]|uniref:Sugar phosphate transporter domain-containing protein n=1 Tax=Stentor coeruleus TaxID=5963 RepID=A0A1R2CWF5_9CILI|nr:hypothetical protein SteCoe_3684 [Stentor coeruleus]